MSIHNQSFGVGAAANPQSQAPKNLSGPTAGFLSKMEEQPPTSLPTRVDQSHQETMINPATASESKISDIETLPTNKITNDDLKTDHKLLSMFKASFKKPLSDTQPERKKQLNAAIKDTLKSLKKERHASKPLLERFTKLSSFILESDEKNNSGSILESLAKDGEKEALIKLYTTDILASVIIGEEAVNRLQTMADLQPDISAANLPRTTDTDHPDGKIDHSIDSSSLPDINELIGDYITDIVPT